MWLVRRKQASMLSKLDGGYVVDVQQFHRAVCLSLSNYCDELLDPTQGSLRENLWRKMNQICAVRTARGLLVDGGSSRPPRE